MDQRKSEKASSLTGLIEALLQGTASEEQMRQLHARLLADAEDRRLYLHLLNLHSALRRQFLFDVGREGSVPFGLGAGAADSVGFPPGPPTRLALASWVAVAAATMVVAVVFLLHFLRPDGAAAIVTITKVHGSLQWTGEGGRVLGALRAGSRLPGGTVESGSSDSWAALTFSDGSTVTVSGQSTLTISQDRQTEIHLHDGSLFVHAARQSPSRPMLIHTPTARLEVLGTQLDVDASRASTVLRVSEGRVRAVRLADGSVAEVPADHEIVISASGQAGFKVRRRPAAVDCWQSNLPADAAYGQWAPNNQGSTPSLRTAPVLLNLRNKPVTVYLVAISVSRNCSSPVLLTPGGRFRIRGRLESPGDIYFGLTTKHLRGGFAGKYLAARRFDPLPGADPHLDIEIPLEHFRPQEKEFAQRLTGLELVDWWCFSYDVDAGLWIDSVELLPAAAPAVVNQTPSLLPRSPLMDIWAAAAQGNIEAIKRHLAAGADIDATFVAPGIAASGATPLHIAVLCDQGEVAQYLIQQGANLDAKADDQHGGTPLHWAAALGRVEMARRLIYAGADVNAPDHHGFTPLDATHYDPQSQAEAKRLIAELLRKKGGKTAQERDQR